MTHDFASGGLFDNSLIKPSTTSFYECLVSDFIEKEIGTNDAENR